MIHQPALHPVLPRQHPGGHRSSTCVVDRTAEHDTAQPQQPHTHVAYASDSHTFNRVPTPLRSHKGQAPLQSTASVLSVLRWNVLCVVYKASPPPSNHPEQATLLTQQSNPTTLTQSNPTNSTCQQPLTRASPPKAGASGNQDRSVDRSTDKSCCPLKQPFSRARQRTQTLGTPLCTWDPSVCDIPHSHSNCDCRRSTTQQLTSNNLSTTARS